MSISQIWFNTHTQNNQGFKRNKTMNDNIMYISNDDKQIYPYCILRLKSLDTASLNKPIIGDGEGKVWGS